MSGRQRVSATKFDEYKSLPTDDEAARLDAFFNELQAQPHLKGYIVAYNSADALPGPFLRRLYGDQKYLTDTRGIAPDRIIAVDGGYRNESATELWLVPTGASPPQSSDAVTEPRVVHRKAYMFDMECLECSPAVQLDLFGMDEGLRFYANELRTHATARAQIIVRPGQEVGLRQALNEAKQAKKLLVRDHGINGRRITVKAASRRKDNVAVAEMWVVSR
ncbi:MAG TPA: hypothetical protein VJV03_09160 [Pyrinomonadaceae bacterium]|nr:hypothetical protein [Pyrinomonadaceae bacterium]